MTFGLVWRHLTAVVYLILCLLDNELLEGTPISIEIFSPGQHLPFSAILEFIASAPGSSTLQRLEDVLVVFELPLPYLSRRGSLRIIAIKLCTCGCNAY